MGLYDNSLYMYRLISRVSEHANIRKDVTEKVVRATIDVIASDIASRGETRIPYILTVKSFEHSGHNHGINGTTIKPSKRMSVKIINGLRKLHARAQRENLDITPDNWRTFVYNQDEDFEGINNISFQSEENLSQDKESFPAPSANNNKVDRFGKPIIPYDPTNDFL